MNKSRGENPSGFEQQGLDREFNRDIVTAAPAVESFVSLETARQVWPEKVVNDPEFQDQIEQRQRLNDNLEKVAAALPRPDISLQTAIEQKLLSEEQVADLFNSLSQLFESDPESKRLALYLPFEYLPNNTWGSGPELQTAMDRFEMAYMNAWGSMLAVHDVRANFVDGDVMEFELRDGDVPRVVKAAHLIPKLVESGIIDIEFVKNLLEMSDDSVLHDSILDTFPVMADMGLISPSEMTIIDKENVREELGDFNNFKTENISKELIDQFKQIDNQKFPEKTTEGRAKWLIAEQKKQVIESIAESVADRILDGSISETNQWQELLGDEVNGAMQQVFITGIRMAMESVAHEDIAKAQEIYKMFEPGLKTLWTNKNSGVHNDLVKTFRRLSSLKIVSDVQISELGLSTSKLDSHSSDHLENMGNEIEDIKTMLAGIEKDPVLSKYVYPVAMIYGSRLKGYGDPESDLDFMVMVKPGTPESAQEEIRQGLRNTFQHDKISGDVTQLWLKDVGEVSDAPGGLEIVSPENYNRIRGDKYMVNALFGSAWEGDAETIQELRQKLLVPYMHGSDEKERGQTARAVYLEDMERENLQYRLMHKGYEKFFPAYGGVKTPHAAHIDGQSMFYDSGYRAIATRLYAKKVFLPKLSPETNK